MGSSAQYAPDFYRMGIHSSTMRIKGGLICRLRVSFVTLYSPREITGVIEISANLEKGPNERGHEYMFVTKTSTEASREIEGLEEFGY